LYATIGQTLVRAVVHNLEEGERSATGRLMLSQYQRLLSTDPPSRARRRVGRHSVNPKMDAHLKLVFEVSSVAKHKDQEDRLSSMLRTMRRASIIVRCCNWKCRYNTFLHHGMKPHGTDAVQVGEASFATLQLLGVSLKVTTTCCQRLVAQSYFRGKHHA